MSLTIERLQAHEILDSRGTPTLAVFVTLSDGTVAQAQVPSGASTGKHEALELRDGDPARYSGKGTIGAVSHVEQDLNALLQGCNAEDLVASDRRMIPYKPHYGANAVLGVSCALARALASSRKQPLWQTLAAIHTPLRSPCVPVPMVNILSGGLHANRNIEFQDFLIIPYGYPTYAEALQAIVQTHRVARQVIEKRGFTCTGVADEGGWGPLLPNNRTALEILTEAIENSGERMTIALDIAASHFLANDRYGLEGSFLNNQEMIEMLDTLGRQFPITSIEDGLGEDEWESWRSLTDRMGDRMQLIGDDLFTTNPERLRRGIKLRAANAVLVKMNQIGTLTETSKCSGSRLRMATAVWCRHAPAKPKIRSWQTWQPPPEPAKSR
ncbi:MAG: phosphopyruvate hydratase [Bryobacteraceae bacterium]